MCTLAILKFPVDVSLLVLPSIIASSLAAEDFSSPVCLSTFLPFDVVGRSFFTRRDSLFPPSPYLRCSRVLIVSSSRLIRTEAQYLHQTRKSPAKKRGAKRRISIARAKWIQTLSSSASLAPRAAFKIEFTVLCGCVCCARPELGTAQTLEENIAPSNRTHTLPRAFVSAFPSRR